LGIGIGIGQYYWVLVALFGIVLTLPRYAATVAAGAKPCKLRTT